MVIENLLNLLETSKTLILIIFVNFYLPNFNDRYFQNLKKFDKESVSEMGNPTVTELQFRVQFNLMWKSFETYM